MSPFARARPGLAMCPAMEGATVQFSGVPTLREAARGGNDCVFVALPVMAWKINWDMF